jgi:hypothetical protein
VSGFGFGVPVLESIVGGKRTSMFDRVEVEKPDWSKAWHNDWQADRTGGKFLGETQKVGGGRAELAQSFELSNGDKVRVTYRLIPGDAAVEIEAVVDKQPIGTPHGIYLPLPTALKSGWECDFETGGANVRLDTEQLPYASRHYITAQRWLRIADAANEVTVACPDVPLWQVGGFTYGRFGEPDGRVERPAPALLAWLTNNYWSTNFQADQAGRLVFNVTLLPGKRQSLAAAAQTAVTYANPMAAHLYAELGPVKSATGSLLTTDLGQLLLTRIERDIDGIALTLLNPSSEKQSVSIGAGVVTPAKARRTKLSGETIGDLAVAGGKVQADIGPREWSRIVVVPA